MKELLARTKELIAQKAFPAPEVGSISYMMSKQQCLSDTLVEELTKRCAEFH
jgi:hypothetical protein